MSLQVWLPLDGNLKNLGCKNVSVTNFGATVDNDGKIGKSYNFNGASSYISIDSILENNISNWSFCCWMKMAVLPSSYYCIFSSRKGSNSNGITIFLSSAKTILVDTGGRWISDAYNFITANQWFHFALINSTTGKKIYINGEQIASSSSTVSPSAVNDNYIIFGAQQTTETGDGTGVYFKGLMNDIRLYDHTLSTQEVKKISQGLILHYPLNNNGRGKPNLIAKVGSGGQTTVLNNYSISVTGANSDTYFPIWTSINLINNNTYTLSAFVEGLQEGTSYSFPLYSQSNNSMGVFIINKNGWNSFTFVKNYDSSNSTTITYNNITLYKILLDDNLRTIAQGQETFTIKAFKLEEGNVRTSFVPHVSSSQYANFNLNDNIQADISGYGRNGTRIEDFTLDTDTSKYKITTNFNGTTNGILIQNLYLSNIINTEITYSFWIKPEGESGGRSVYFSSYRGVSWSLEKAANNNLRSYWNGSPDKYATLVIVDNVWQHIAITKKGNNEVKAYLNGQLAWTSTDTYNNLTFPTTYRIGRDTRQNDGTPYKGKMSDFRIYATALSAEDVKELYQYNNINI